jgi:hypothetical protein
MVLDFALSAAQTFVENKVQQKIGAISQKFEKGAASFSGVSSAQRPDWYTAAVQEQQPRMDPTELARIQAEEISNARANEQIAQSMMDHMRNMSKIMTSR